MEREYKSVVQENEIFESKIPDPHYRMLRGYTFDPSLSTQPETSIINTATFKVKWEKLEKGPKGQYVEVIDIDPASKLIYDGVNLDDPNILAQDGLAPSEGNPQFHQQMVYTIAMRTIENFEKALGRKALWSGRFDEQKNNETYVQRLRIYPHALREANAYYSPTKKALLFGYFPATTRDVTQHLPEGMVFTCLSQDIIAHETTHALLDGMHRRYIEDTHPDTLAFHEAFADIVALFQHFSMSEVLVHQIAKTKGDLSSQSLLVELAQQFGKAIGHYGALRSAIGNINQETKQWEQSKPAPEMYNTVKEPHLRGAILVSAIFEAFISIYKLRVKDLFGIASGGSGILPEGELHPTLVKLLASQAAKAANHVLAMCIRALDYCPPVDIDFGDYLRAIITADADIVPNDDMNYRVAFIDAFKRRGIIPKGIKTLSLEGLNYPIVKAGNISTKLSYIAGFLRDFQSEIYYADSREKLYNATKKFKAHLRSRLMTKFEDSKEFSDLTGLLFSDFDIERYSLKSLPETEVHSLKWARRVSPDGKANNQAILSLTQKRIITKNEWEEIIQDDKHRTQFSDLEFGTDEVIFRGGSTMIIDLDKQVLKYCINKPIVDTERLKSQVLHQKGFQATSLFGTYFSKSLNQNNPEPLALLHRL